MAAARKQFVRSGIRDARIEDLTQASGLSKGAFYLHFESKEALFAQLVSSFQSQLERIGRERDAVVRSYLAHRPRSAQALVALELKYNREVLEHIWNEREVFAVLSRGAQGTVFEGFVWQMAEREVERVVASIESMKRVGACRADVPSRVYGSLVVGSYLLVAQQISRLERKPDLDVWVRALQQLIRDGVALRDAPLRRKKRVVIRPAGAARLARSAERRLS